MGSEQVLILATFGSRDEAERAGEKLVEQQLVGTGAVIPTVHTFHFREGRMHRNHEALLLLQTSVERVREVQQLILAESPEAAPQTLSIAVDLAAR